MTKFTNYNQFNINHLDPILLAKFVQDQTPEFGGQDCSHFTVVLPENWEANSTIRDKPSRNCIQLVDKRTNKVAAYACRVVYVHDGIVHFDWNEFYNSLNFDPNYIKCLEEESDQYIEQSEFFE